MSNIYYICLDVPTPAGGIKVIYQHVEMLCKHGMNASIVHFKEGFRCDWFENDVPIRYINTLQPASTDIIVIPAIWSRKLISFAPRIKKVIINQGAYLTFGGYPVDNRVVESPYHHPDVLATLVVSEDNKRYLQYVFRDLIVRRVRNYIDIERFPFTEKKSQQIAFMTRKRYEDVEQVINILKYRGVLDGYTLAPVNEATEAQVSEILQESLLFLNFCVEEGWSLPAAEAMSCGCVVIGNHGFGARELLLSEFSYPVDQHDIIQFARTVEDVITRNRLTPNILNEKSRMGSDFIRNNHTRAIAEKELMAFWEEFLPG